MDIDCTRKIIGTGNGNPGSHDPDKVNQRMANHVIGVCPIDHWEECIPFISKDTTQKVCYPIKAKKESMVHHERV